MIILICLPFCTYNINGLLGSNYELLLLNKKNYELLSTRDISTVGKHLKSIFFRSWFESYSLLYFLWIKIIVMSQNKIMNYDLR